MFTVFFTRFPDFLNKDLGLDEGSPGRPSYTSVQFIFKRLFTILYHFFHLSSEVPPELSGLTDLPFVNILHSDNRPRHQTWTFGSLIPPFPPY